MAKQLKSFIFKTGQERGMDGHSFELGFHFAFDDYLGHKCKVKALSLDGIITAMTVSRNHGIEYQVRYFCDGKLNELWLYDEEVELVAEKKKC